MSTNKAKAVKKTVSKKTDAMAGYLGNSGSLPATSNYPTHYDSQYVRQDSLRAALDIFKQPENVRDATPTNIINLANLFEKYVLGGYGAVAVAQDAKQEAPKFS